VDHAVRVRDISIDASGRLSSHHERVSCDRFHFYMSPAHDL